MGLQPERIGDNLKVTDFTLSDEAFFKMTWADNPAMRAAVRPDLPPAEAYYDLLRPHCTRIDIWHSVYNHVMASPQAIVEWFKGSSLQPFLSPLDAAAREKFLAAFAEKIARAYQPRVDGKLLLRFPRLFIVAVR
jgi:trans-aconitate 2-methyltransferase